MQRGECSHGLIQSNEMHPSLVSGRTKMKRVHEQCPGPSDGEAAHRSACAHCGHCISQGGDFT